VCGDEDAVQLNITSTSTQQHSLAQQPCCGCTFGYKVYSAVWTCSMVNMAAGRYVACVLHQLVQHQEIVSFVVDAMCSCATCRASGRAPAWYQ
jgi:hypothetical protein